MAIERYTQYHQCENHTDGFIGQISRNKDGKVMILTPDDGELICGDNAAKEFALMILGFLTDRQEEKTHVDL